MSTKTNNLWLNSMLQKYSRLNIAVIIKVVTADLLCEKMLDSEKISDEFAQIRLSPFRLYKHFVIAIIYFTLRHRRCISTVQIFQMIPGFSEIAPTRIDTHGALFGKKLPKQNAKGVK